MTVWTLMELSGLQGGKKEVGRRDTRVVQGELEGQEVNMIECDHPL